MEFWQYSCEESPESKGSLAPFQSQDYKTMSRKGVGRDDYKKIMTFPITLPNAVNDHNSIYKIYSGPDSFYKNPDDRLQRRRRPKLEQSRSQLVGERTLNFLTPFWIHQLTFFALRHGRILRSDIDYHDHRTGHSGL